MSTGLECEFVKTGGSWYYVLEHGSAPKMAWDWREYATAYGPFASKDDADAHLRRYQANPGGSSTDDLDERGAKPDAVLAGLIAEART